MSTLVATMVTYFSLPIYDDSRGPYLWLRLLIFVVGLAGLVYLLVRQISVARKATVYQQRVQWLSTAICLAVLGFAVTYIVMARSGQNQFDQLWTKTDALYFTVTVLTTVGFGDVHATGQVARLVVTVQMGFDVLFIATAGSALRAAGADRRRRYLDLPDE